MSDWNFVIEDPFFEFAAILALAAVLGIIGKYLRQPLIVTFIVLGILVGPSVFGIATSEEKITLLADIGIAILLFIVGLKLDLHIVRTIGKVALITGLGQVVFTSLIGYFIGVSLGFTSLHSFYIAIALTFSSTIIIVKLLSDKKEIDSLHGQIAIGFLIVQDLVVILLMIVLTGLGQETDGAFTTGILKTLLAGGFLLVLIFALSKWVLPGLTQHLAKNRELLILFALALAVGMDALSAWLGFSGEVGAFLAGVSLASSEFRDVMSNRLESIRDFLLLFFFINLGVNIDLSIIGNQISPALIFSFFVLAGNPLIVLVIMGVMGYRKRTSFLAGLTVAQISEFSLIFAGLGLSLGHINEDVLGLITLVGLITIGLSTYLILYSHAIYEFLSPMLNIFQRKGRYSEFEMENRHPFWPDVIILGYGRFGSAIANMLEEHKETTYLGIDFDPQVVKRHRGLGRNISYGDMEDPEMLDHIPFHNSRCIINTIPDIEVALRITRDLKRRSFKGEIYTIARQQKDRELLSALKGLHILMPHEMVATNLYNSYLKKNLDIEDPKEVEDDDPAKDN